jgi:hypothetical protein
MKKYLLSYLLAFLLLLFPSCLNVAVAAGGYDGTYKLAKLLDKQGNAMDLPQGNFNLVLVSSGGTGTIYRLTLHVANHLGSSIKVSEGNQVDVAPMRSTMMKPPPKIDELENRLKNMLPYSDTIDLTNGKLTLEGTRGVAVFEM